MMEANIKGANGEGGGSIGKGREFGWVDERRGSKRKKK